MTPAELLKRLRTRPTPEKLETVEQYRQHVISEQTGRAGSTKSAAKAEAARLNGAKGGRPRKGIASTRGDPFLFGLREE